MLVSPNGARVYIHGTPCHQKAVLGWSSGAIGICENPDRVSGLEKNLFPVIHSLHWVMTGFGLGVDRSIIDAHAGVSPVSV